MEWSIVS